MSVPNPEMAERHSRVLGELAEITLSAARRLGEELQGAESAAEMKDLAMGLARVSRQVRQAVLLEAKLARDGVLCGRELAREEAAELKAAAEALTKHRRARVLHEVTRAIGEQAESAEQAEDLQTEAEAALNAWVDGHDWESRTLDDLIADMCDELGLEAPGDADDDSEAPAAAPPPAPRLIQGGGWAPPQDSS